MSTLSVNNITPANPGSESYFLAKAWVNFNSLATVAIRASGNVSSITDNGVGNYIVNFTTAMPDVNYSAHVTKEPSAYLIGNIVYDARLSSTPSNLLVLSAENGALRDSVNINVAVFR